MKPNLMFAFGHAVSALRRRETARACNAIISLSLLSPVRNAMRTRKLTRISHIAGAGWNSSASGDIDTAGAATDLSLLPAVLSSPSSMSSALAMTASSSSSSSSSVAADRPRRRDARPPSPLDFLSPLAAASFLSVPEASRPRFLPAFSGGSSSSS